MNAPESLHEFETYHRRMLALMVGVCLAATAAVFIIIPGELRWGGGFVAGAAAQLFKFGFLDIAAVRKMAAHSDAAAMTQVKSMYLSLVIFGLAAAVVYKFSLNVWAMAAGIFLPRLILLADAYFRPNPFGKKTEGTSEESDCGQQEE